MQIIIDISHENLDKTYQYAILEEDIKSISIGAQVIVPFEEVIVKLAVL